MLEEMVVKDLLGPAGGDSEELTERNVRDRYLVGVLAPRRKAAGGPPAAPSEEGDEDLPLIPDEVSQGGADSLDDGNTDLNVPLARAHLPSSFGMTFCLTAEAKSLKVSACWGQYLRERKEDEIDEKTGRGSSSGNVIHEAASRNCPSGTGRSEWSLWMQSAQRSTSKG